MVVATLATDDVSESVEHVAGQARLAEQVVEARAKLAQDKVEDDASRAARTVEDLASVAAAIVAEHASATTRATQDVAEAQRKVRHTVAILAVSVMLMVIVGLTVGVVLLIRSNDAQDVQQQIENRVAQTERTFCAYMEQRAAIETSDSDKLLSAQAKILIQRFGCENKL